VGGVTVEFREWVTGGDEPERQPLMVLNGGDGDIEEQAYRFWKAPDLKRRLRKLFNGAQAAGQVLRTAQDTLLAEAAQSQTISEQPFEQADALTAALARLDQINAALHDAASKKTRPTQDDVVVASDEVEIDLDEMADTFGDMLASLDDEVAGDLAELMGDDLAGLFG
jgi:DNA mismatch repair ATPase MutS